MPRIEMIGAQGLRDFSRALKRMDRDLPKALRRALNDAVSIVVADAKPRVPRLTGRAAASIRTASAQTAARIRAGGNRVPYYGWLDFGGVRRGRGGGVAQRQFRQKGRYIWLSFGENRERVLAAVEEAIDDIARQAGIEVTRG